MQRNIAPHMHKNGVVCDSVCVFFFTWFQLNTHSIFVAFVTLFFLLLLLLCA